MEALILSCSTGGGHNGAAYAIKEELEKHGHHVVMMDPYALVGNNLDQKIGNTYIRLVQKAPKLFGLVYLAGDLYRKLPVHSPVYWINMKMVEPFREFLEEHHFDVILFPHVFPGEILACMKSKNIKLPTTIFVATDYTCIPFTEETDSDFYVVPSDRKVSEFIAKGIEEEKILPFGIPVRQEFRDRPDREDAIARLGLDPKRHYLLMMGGSMGAGKIPMAVACMLDFLKKNSEYTLIVICGSNEKLYERLSHYFSKKEQILLLHTTNQLADYMSASDMMISKPGGLTSTEAAAFGIPLIHFSAIPGCETKNTEFFSENGMSINVGRKVYKLPSAVEYLRDAKTSDEMKELQEQVVNADAVEELREFVEKIG